MTHLVKGWNCQGIQGRCHTQDATAIRHGNTDVIYGLEAILRKVSSTISVNNNRAIAQAHHAGGVNKGNGQRQTRIFWKAMIYYTCTDNYWLTMSCVWNWTFIVLQQRLKLVLSFFNTILMSVRDQLPTSQGHWLSYSVGIVIFIRRLLPLSMHSISFINFSMEGISFWSQTTSPCLTLFGPSKETPLLHM